MRSLKLTVFLKIKFLLSSFFIMNYFGYVKKNDIASHVFTADRKGQSLDTAAEPPGTSAPGRLLAPGEARPWVGLSGPHVSGGSAARHV